MVTQEAGGVTQELAPSRVGELRQEARRHDGQKTVDSPTNRVGTREQTP